MFTILKLLSSPFLLLYLEVLLHNNEFARIVNKVTAAVNFSQHKIALSITESVDGVVVDLVG